MDVKKILLLLIVFLIGCAPSTPIEDIFQEEIKEVVEEPKEEIIEETYEDLQTADDTFNALDIAFNALSKS